MLELPAESANVTFRSWDPGKRHHLQVAGRPLWREGSDFYSPVFHPTVRETQAEVWPVGFPVLLPECL